MLNIEQWLFIFNVIKWVYPVHIKVNVTYIDVAHFEEIRKFCV